MLTYLAGWTRSSRTRRRATRNGAAVSAESVYSRPALRLRALGWTLQP